MTDSDTLAPRKSRFVAALLTSATIAEAARRAELSESTACRYLRDTDVKSALAEQRDVLLDYVTAGVALDVGLARKALLEIAQNPHASDSARVAAAKALLDNALQVLAQAAAKAKADAPDPYDAPPKPPRLYLDRLAARLG